MKSSSRNMLAPARLALVCAVLLSGVVLAVESPFSPAQGVFMEMVGRCSQRIGQLTNPVQRSTAIEECNGEMRKWSEANSTIESWNGVLRELHPYGDGELAVVISTTMTDLAAPPANPIFGAMIRGRIALIDFNATGEGLVAKGSPVYSQLASVNVGEFVTFSANVRSAFVDFADFRLGRHQFAIVLKDIRPLQSPESDARSIKSETEVARPSVPQYAPSFDCTKAASNVESMICSDETLSRFDQRLASLYRNVIREAGDPGSVKLSQRQWLSTIRNRCSDSGCIEAAYRNRYAELESIYDRGQR